MPDLLVANPTGQHMHFNYRCPRIGNGKVLQQTIPARQQIRLHENLEEDQLEIIIAQLEKIGAIEGSEVRNLHLPKTLVWSVDRPVSQKQMNEAAAKDEDARQKKADEQAELAGQGAFPIDQRTAAHTNAATLEIIELENPDGKEKPAKGGFASSTTVSKRAGKPARVK